MTEPSIRQRDCGIGLSIIVTQSTVTSRSSVQIVLSTLISRILPKAFTDSTEHTRLRFLAFDITISRRATSAMTVIHSRRVVFHTEGNLYLSIYICYKYIHLYTPYIYFYTPCIYIYIFFFC